MHGLKLDTPKAHTLHINSLTNGLDLSREAQEGSLCVCKNLWQKDGFLQSRPALSTDITHIIGNGQYYEADNGSAHLSDIEYESNGTVYRLAYKCAEQDGSAYFCFVNLLGPDGTSFKSSQIGFYRLSDSVFNIPKKLSFFKGSPQSGSGIYLAVKLTNCENLIEQSSAIYELSSSLEEWVNVHSSYIPTVLINGRGNRYDFARQADQVSTASPDFLEELNILNPDFYSYFSTDGYSSSFKLPFSSLLDKPVTASLNYSEGAYTDWYIDYGSNQSTAMVYGTSVTMHINRERGIVSFSVPSGEYSLPMCSDLSANNLKISASKDCGLSLEQIADADCTAALDGKLFFGSGNRIFSSDFANPLYFPLSSVALLDSADSRLTAMAPLNGSLWAFAQNRIWLVSVNEGKRLENYFSFQKNGIALKTAHTLTAECIAANTAGAKPQFITEYNKKLYFFGTDGEFYRINKSGCENISCKISDMLPLVVNTFSSFFSIRYRHFVMFFCGNKALVLDLFKNRDAWYFWQFPQGIKICGAYVAENTPVLLCCLTDSYLHFTARLCGIYDRILSGSLQDVSVTTSEIEYELCTSRLALGCENEEKSINCIALDLQCKGLTATVNNLPCLERYSCDTLKTVKIRSPITAASTVGIALHGKAPIKLGGICVTYTALKL